MRILRALDGKVEELGAELALYKGLPGKVDQALRVQEETKAQMTGIAKSQAELAEKADAAHKAATETRRLAETHQRLLRGDPDLSHPGIMDRMGEMSGKMDKLTKTLEELRQGERDRERLIKGMLIGLSITGVTGIGTLITTILQAVGGSP